MISKMDGDSCDPDANTCFLNNNGIYFGISAHEKVQVCLFVSIFEKEKEFVL
jgi:hypothetical protein